MKALSFDDISRLNLLLDDTLKQASHEQLATCIKLLGTSLAHLKNKYVIDEDKNSSEFSSFVSELENDAQGDTQRDAQRDAQRDEFKDLAAKTIVECATAMAVAKEGINKH